MSPGFPHEPIRPEAYPKRMPRENQDHYFRQAKRDGYRSRAAYKLIEIDERKRIFSEGDHVLDCGCAPGSWVQVAAKLVGPEGVVVGIDLKPVEGNLRENNIHIIQGDLREISRDDLLTPLHEKKGTVPPPEKKFQVVLSDMAPDTTGDQTTDHHRSVRLCRALLERLPELLGKGGNAVFKVFEGEAYPELLTQFRGMFDRVKGFKPKASRNESREMYIIAHGFTGASAATEPDEDTEPSFVLPKHKPSKGWGEKRP